MAPKEIKSEENVKLETKGSELVQKHLCCPSLKIHTWSETMVCVGSLFSPHLLGDVPFHSGYTQAGTPTGNSRALMHTRTNARTHARMRVSPRQQNHFQPPRTCSSRPPSPHRSPLGRGENFFSHLDTNIYKFIYTSLLQDLHSYYMVWQNTLCN